MGMAVLKLSVEMIHGHIVQWQQVLKVFFLIKSEIGNDVSVLLSP